MDFATWAETVPVSITGDSLWKMQAYQLALFASDIGWHDVTKLLGDKRTMSVADQLYRALGSISANLAEGYSYGTGQNRARMYEYALGSARESRNWYYIGRHILGEQVAMHRQQFLTRVIQLILVMVPDQRGRTIREDRVAYEIAEGSETSNAVIQFLDILLQNVPMSVSYDVSRLTHQRFIK